MATTTQQKTAIQRYFTMTQYHRLFLHCLLLVVLVLSAGSIVTSNRFDDDSDRTNQHTYNSDDDHDICSRPSFSFLAQNLSSNLTVNSISSSYGTATQYGDDNADATETTPFSTPLASKTTVHTNQHSLIAVSVLVTSSSLTEETVSSASHHHYHHDPSFILADSVGLASWLSSFRWLLTVEEVPVPSSPMLQQHRRETFQVEGRKEDEKEQDDLIYLSKSIVLYWEGTNSSNDNTSTPTSWKFGYNVVGRATSSFVLPLEDSNLQLQHKQAKLNQHSSSPLMEDPSRTFIVSLWNVAPLTWDGDGSDTPEEAPTAEDEDDNDPSKQRRLLTRRLVTLPRRVSHRQTINPVAKVSLHYTVPPLALTQSNEIDTDLSSQALHLNFFRTIFVVLFSLVRCSLAYCTLVCTVLYGYYRLRKRVQYHRDLSSKSTVSSDENLVAMRFTTSVSITDMQEEMENETADGEKIDKKSSSEKAGGREPDEEVQSRADDKRMEEEEEEEEDRTSDDSEDRTLDAEQNPEEYRHSIATRKERSNHENVEKQVPPIRRCRSIDGMEVPEATTRKSIQTEYDERDANAPCEEPCEEKQSEGRTDELEETFGKYQPSLNEEHTENKKQAQLESGSSLNAESPRIRKNDTPEYNLTRTNGSEQSQEGLVETDERRVDEDDDDGDSGSAHAEDLQSSSRLNNGQQPVSTANISKGDNQKFLSTQSLSASIGDGQPRSKTLSELVHGDMSMDTVKEGDRKVICSHNAESIFCNELLCDHDDGQGTHNGLCSFRRGTEILTQFSLEAGQTQHSQTQRSSDQLIAELNFPRSVEAPVGISGGIDKEPGHPDQATDNDNVHVPDNGPIQSPGKQCLNSDGEESYESTLPPCSDYQSEEDLAVNPIPNETHNVDEVTTNDPTSNHRKQHKSAFPNSNIRGEDRCSSSSDSVNEHSPALPTTDCIDAGEYLTRRKKQVLTGHAQHKKKSQSTGLEFPKNSPTISKKTGKRPYQDSSIVVDHIPSTSLQSTSKQFAGDGKWNMTRSCEGGHRMIPRTIALPLPAKKKLRTK